MTEEIARVIKSDERRFELVRETRWQGTVKIYKDRLSGQHVAVSRAYTFDRGDETMAFLYDNDADEVINWTEITAGYGVTHDELISTIEDELDRRPRELQPHFLELEESED